MIDRPAVSRRIVLDIFILSGAAGLIYEVVWARQLVLVFGNTTQAVSAILTGFFGGMAIGSAVGGRLADRVRRPFRLYGLLELILVVVVILTPITFRLLHEVYRGAFASLEASPGLLALVRFALALLALGPATILMGATLPTLTRYLTRQRGPPVRGVRPAVRGEHARGDHRDGPRRLRPHRAARADRDAARGSGVLGASPARSPCSSTGGSPGGSRRVARRRGRCRGTVRACRARPAAADLPRPSGSACSSPSSPA